MPGLLKLLRKLRKSDSEMKVSVFRALPPCWELVSLLVIMCEVAKQTETKPSSHEHNCPPRPTPPRPFLPATQTFSWR